MAEKFAKDDVDYSKGHPASHCGQMFESDKGYCDHFLRRSQGYTGSGECALVSGMIRRDYWCRKFRKAVTK